MLSIVGCRARQRRLCAELSRLGLDGALLTQREHVYYFTNHRAHWNHASAAWIEAGGRTVLLGWKPEREAVAADDWVTYPAHSTPGTMPSDQARLAAEAFAPKLPSGRRLGVDLAGPGALARLAGPDAPDLTAVLLRLRKRKDPDEVACLRRAIALTEELYAAAKAALRPGLDEVDLFAELRRVATRWAGADLEYFGNDFQAATPGGKPRRRAMQAGELYVLDLGPALDGYHADNCRTFAVDGKGTDVQHAACAKVAACLEHLERLIRPGLSCKDLFQTAKTFLSDAGHSGLCHHLGHGIGLQPHEAPQLNPEFDAVFEAGDVFTMEPGLYSDALHAGIRLEHDYLLSAGGLERLTKFPLGLA